MSGADDAAPAAPDALFGLPMRMVQTFGLVGETIGGDRSCVRMPFDIRHTNSRGDVHGGALAVLFDCTLASAARAHDPSRYGVFTVDMTVHYLAPSSGDVTARAVCERRGRSLCFVRGQAHDADGGLLAIATGTFKLVPR